MSKPNDSNMKKLGLGHLEYRTPQPKNKPMSTPNNELLAAAKAVVEVADSAMWDKAFGAETVARFMAKSVDLRIAIAKTEKANS